MVRVIVELRIPKLDMSLVTELISAYEDYGFKPDKEWRAILPTEKSISLTSEPTKGTICIRGDIPEDKMDELRQAPNVENIWTDAKIVPFNSGTALDITLPCESYDCDHTTAKGDLEEVVRYLGVDYIWKDGCKGKNITIAICDTGVNKEKVAAYSDGWSPSPIYMPGADSDTGHEHGTMCAFDASYICPDAKIYDIGVLKGSGGIEGALSDAISGFQWAIDRFKRDRTPQVMSNSWGIYQESWAPDYAKDVNHPFTRKVKEAIKLGIIVAFAAGNCGPICPSTRCGVDIGSGRSIWGANSLTEVVTFGAANIRGEWIGYSSCGPGALEAKKPDLCSISHFKGYHNCDNGTSAATPVGAAIIALLKSHKINLSPADVRDVLQKTCRDCCSSGWDVQSGSGIINAKAAYLSIKEPGIVDLEKLCAELKTAKNKVQECAEILDTIIKDHCK
jgi:subtilisin family serine protease